MHEKTKLEEKNNQENAEKDKKEDQSAIVKDQTERSYYYDDACGYEVYIEEELEDEN